MNRFFNRQMNQLNELAAKDEVKTSIMLPLVNLLVPEQKLLGGLISTANNLIGKNKKRINLNTGNLDKWRKKGALSLAIYHCGDEAIYFPLPFHMEPRVIVADSFHIKPLLAAINGHTEAILVHFHNWGATLFRVSENNVDRIDSILPANKDTHTIWHYDMSKEGIVDFINFIQQELIVYAGQQTSLIAITGNGNDYIQNRSLWKPMGIPLLFMEESWRSIYPEKAIAVLKRLLNQQVERMHSQEVEQILTKEHITNQHSNFDHLLDKVLNKKVSELIVSLDDIQFGTIDIKSGKTILFKKQNGSYDDDILDDMVEIAIQRGIKVKVVPRTFMPSGLTFIAA